jgi:hypothetical protein
VVIGDKIAAEAVVRSDGAEMQSGLLWNPSIAVEILGLLFSCSSSIHPTLLLSPPSSSKVKAVNGKSWERCTFCSCSYKSIESGEKAPFLYW